MLLPHHRLLPYSDQQNELDQKPPLSAKSLFGESANKNSPSFKKTPEKCDYKGVISAEPLTAKKEMELEAQFQKAVLILSQSETGRDLLKRAYDAGYGFVFDDKRVGQPSAALCDHSTKMIILHSETPLAYLALVIAHEAVHAVQGGFEHLLPSTKYRIEEGVKLSFAIEADAYAQQTVVAFELLAAGQVEPLSFMQRYFPDLTEVAQKVLQEMKPQEDASQKVAAFCFDAFYNSDRFRSFYENEHVSWLIQKAERAPKWFNERAGHYKKEITTEEIRSKIKHKGQSYLKRTDVNIDFDKARYAGVTSETKEKILIFYKKNQPEVAVPVIKTYGQYIEPPSSTAPEIISKAALKPPIHKILKKVK